MGKGAQKMARAIELAKMIDAEEPTHADGQSHQHSSNWHRRIALNNCVLLAEVGSRVTGVPRKNDADFTGVCIEPAEVVLAINAMNTPAFGQYEYATTPDAEPNKPGDIDVTIYSLRKFARMAASGAPTALIPLFVPQNAYEVSLIAGATLRARRELFVTKMAGLKFAGMGRMHAHRIKQGQGRKELIAKSGYDTDYAYHGLRALIWGRDLMEHGDIVLPLEKVNYDYLESVREGSYTRKQVVKDFINFGAELAAQIDAADLPDHADYDKINQMVHVLYVEHWEGQR